MSRNSQETTHHLCPRSRGGSEDTKNKTEWKKYFHQDFHEVFGTDLPHEQVLHLLEWDSQVIIQPTFEEIVELVRERMKQGAFYEDRVLKKR